MASNAVNPTIATTAIAFLFIAAPPRAMVGNRPAATRSLNVRFPRITDTPVEAKRYATAAALGLSINNLPLAQCSKVIRSAYWPADKGVGVAADIFAELDASAHHVDAHL